MKTVFYSTSAEDLFRYRLPVARRLRDAGYTIVFVGPGGEFAARTEQQGFTYRRTGRSMEGTSLLSDVVVGLQLTRIYREERPDIAHHFTMRGIVRGALAARLSRIGWVVHSVPPLTNAAGDRRLPRFDRRFALRAALRGAEVTFRTYEDRQLLLTDGSVRPEQTHILAGAGIELASYPSSPESDRTPIAALIGPLDDTGSVETFVEAARRLRSKGCGARFVLVATSSGGPAVLPGLLDSWQEEGVIEWWGRRRDVAHVMKIVHVACVTQPCGGEIPYLMLEAAAAGRPLVAADDPAVRSLVRNDYTGYAVSPGDVDALTRAVDVLLADGARRRCMGSNARALVESEFSADHVARQTMKVYETLYRKGRNV